MSETRTRVTTAVVLVPAILVLLFIGGLPWGVFVAVAAGIGTFEFYQMARARGYNPVAPVGIAVSVGICLALAMNDLVLAMTLLVGGTMAVSALDIRRNDPSGSIENIGASLVGIVYVGFLLSHAILLRNIGQDGLGIFCIFLALAGCMLCDTGAYFIGRAYGKGKLIPNISPGKTDQGTIGGIVSGTAAICFITLIGGMFVDVPFGLGGAAILGVLISVGGVVGDLIESMFKRDAGVKDSGKIIPGHGGFMDRLDSLLWALPITYYFTIWATRL